MVVKKIFSLPTHCLRIGNINRYSIVVEPEMLARYGAYFSAKDPRNPEMSMNCAKCTHLAGCSPIKPLLHPHTPLQSV